MADRPVLPRVSRVALDHDAVQVDHAQLEKGRAVPTTTRHSTVSLTHTHSPPSSARSCDVRGRGRPTDLDNDDFKDDVASRQRNAFGQHRRGRLHDRADVAAREHVPEVSERDTVVLCTMGGERTKRPARTVRCNGRARSCGLVRECGSPSLAWSQRPRPKNAPLQTP